MISSSNFREIQCGKIAPNTLYRSNHPVCGGEQVKDVIISAKKAGIKTIINLSDSMRSIMSKIVCCPWYKSIFEKGNGIALNISMKFDIMNKKFTHKINDGLTFMLDHEPPYLIHCEAGIDRTGFLSMLLEAFMEAPLDAIAKDYMLSYVNNDEYSPDDNNNGKKFITNVFDNLKGDSKNQNENPHDAAKTYLLEKIGLNSNELQMLSNKLQKSHPQTPASA